MSRNEELQQDRETIGGPPPSTEMIGPVGFMNPTQIRLQYNETSIPRQAVPQAHGSTDQGLQPLPIFQYRWTSRNNRKGRHAIIISRDATVSAAETGRTMPESTARWRSVSHTLWLMLTYYPVWDISWCVAYVFTWGSALWILNGLFIFLPFVRPESTFHNQVLVGGGVSAFAGTTVFELGSILLFLEAVNTNRVECFGWAVEEAYEQHFGHQEPRSVLTITPDLNSCRHHQQNKKSLLNLGFIGSTSQLIGTTIFWIAGFTALPGIFNHLSHDALYGAYWFPLVCGAVFFVFSGFVFMIETQKRWWKPAPGTLGWHIGLWNFIGGIGFLLSPCFGLCPQHWAQYQAACVSLWASCAFFLGSAMQWYESLEKSPVAVKRLE